MQPAGLLSSWSCCQSLPRAAIIDMRYHTYLTLLEWFHILHGQPKGLFPTIWETNLIIEISQEASISLVLWPDLYKARKHMLASWLGGCSSGIHLPVVQWPPEDSDCVHPSSKRTQCLWSGYSRTKPETKWVCCCLHCLGGCLPWTALTGETFKYSICPHTLNLLQTMQLKKVNLKNAYTDRKCFLSCSCVRCL